MVCLRSISPLLFISQNKHYSCPKYIKIIVPISDINDSLNMGIIVLCDCVRTDASVTVDVTMPVGNVPTLIFAVANATYRVEL